MNLLEVCQKVCNEHQCHNIRVFKGELQAQPWDGNKKGWTILDATTANAFVCVYNHLRQDQKEKLLGMEPFRALDIAWKTLKKVAGG